MKQVLQLVDNGQTQVRDVPVPWCGPREVLVANAASLISAGTEKAVIELARKSLLGKAKERPDHVKRILAKIRQEGVLSTLRQVREKLSDPMALGYASAGTVLEVGREVSHVRPGDLVATNGAHAEVVAVPALLVAKVPQGLSANAACYATLGAVALQGIRLGNAVLGHRVAVIGLGLIGQLTVILLRAAGCKVLATDLSPARRLQAEQAGAMVAPPAGFATLVADETQGHGADSVLITASTSSNEPLQTAAEVARKRGRIVAVGAIGLNVPRREFYPKELELVVSCSYGPGRYDTNYEKLGHDYPLAHVRFTAQRNMESFLEQAARDSAAILGLTSHTFPIDQAEQAYALLSNSADCMGIVLQYPNANDQAARFCRTQSLAGPVSAANGGNGNLSPARAAGRLKIGLAGAGNYASMVLIPALKQLPVALSVICSAGGVSASSRGQRHGFERATTDFDFLVQDTQVDCVFIATRHDQHVDQAMAALSAGKAAFIEKPLAIQAASLRKFQEFCGGQSGLVPPWTVGFNRRFSPAARTVKDFIKDTAAPFTVMYRFNAGAIPSDHWTQEPTIGGGRIIGEACHAIDLIAYLTGETVTQVHCAAVAPGRHTGRGDDHALITLWLSNGSIATIGYFAGGDRSLGKERVEIHGGGQSAVIDDFQTVSLARGGRIKSKSCGKGQKGHPQLLAAFLEAANGAGAWPIPPESLLNTSWASLAAVASLQTGQAVRVLENGLADHLPDREHLPEVGGSTSPADGGPVPTPPNHASSQEDLA